MTALSKYATLDECSKSVTASRLGIDNNPPVEVRDNLREVCSKVFDACREFVGGPLGIASGYRSPKLNKAVGGSKTSQHMTGEALDIDCDVFKNGNNKDLFFFIKNNLKFDQMIAEFKNGSNPEWIHVSYSRLHNRGQILIATKKNGKTVYLPYSDKLFTEIYG
jgi:zinc D-Ala-D-Ala carboxypeptidase